MKARLNQDEVAAALEVNRSAVAKWETGKALPRAEKLVRLARLYHCTVGELIGEPEQAAQ